MLNDGKVPQRHRNDKQSPATPGGRFNARRARFVALTTALAWSGPLLLVSLLSGLGALAWSGRLPRPRPSSPRPPAANSS